MLKRMLGLRALALTLVLIAGTGLCGATPYWIAYEGNDFPENEGWWRIYGVYPAQRSLEDGCLVLDTLSNVLAAEYYEWPTPGAVDPGPGEEFLMTWRVRVEEAQGSTDPAVLIGSDAGNAAAFSMGVDHLVVSFTAGMVQVPYAPGVFHEFLLRSADMQDYELYLDGELVLQHPFKPDTSHISRQGWGHGTEGVSSRAHWDYVRFGVIPEPCSAMALLCLCVLCRVGRRSQQSLADVP